MGALRPAVELACPDGFDVLVGLPVHACEKLRCKFRPFVQRKSHGGVQKLTSKHVHAVRLPQLAGLSEWHWFGTAPRPSAER